MGLMRPMGLMRLMGLMGLMGLLLSGCQSEEDLRPETTVELQSYVTGYEAYEANKAKVAHRAWTAPTGYTLFDDSSHPAIGVFFTKDGQETLTTRIWYGSDSKWRITDTPAVDDYQLYGYIPKDAANVSIAANGTYADGAVMTITGLNTISTKDVCVIVGAKNNNSESDDGLQTGQFGCTMRDSESGGHNYLYLLFDHLYAALRFQFQIDPVYNELRDIKIKALELKAYTDNTYTTPLKEKVSTSVTLTKTDDGSSPITEELVFVEEGETRMDYTLFYYDEESPIELSSSEWRGPTCYVVKTGEYFTLRTTYDVYDKNGQCIRQNCKAENKLNMSQLFGLTLLRGYLYTLKFTVQPTYLYMLSENDLDNPTIKIDD